MLISSSTFHPSNSNDISGSAQIAGATFSLGLPLVELHPLLPSEPISEIQPEDSFPPSDLAVCINYHHSKLLTIHIFRQILYQFRFCDLLELFCDIPQVYSLD